MKRLYLTFTVFFLSLAAKPALALECANAGTAPKSPPDDTGLGVATACGGSAVAGGFYSTALGFRASSSSDFSTALGYSAYAGGDFSTALGDHAYAPDPDTIVLGAIQGVNFASNYADVAIGTTDPTAPLHVHRRDGTARILVEESNPVAGPRTLFTLANTGNTKFAIEETGTGNTWAFTNNGYEFRVSLQGSGGPEFSVDNYGDAYLKGLLYENSDRNAKTDIAPVDPSTILEKVTRLPIALWAYKEKPETRHIGPMAQDFRAIFGTGASDTTLATMDISGVAVASIQALNEKLEQQTGELKQRNPRLEQENESLREELGQLRGLRKEVAVLREQVQRLQASIAASVHDEVRIAVK
jgi:hypothetical protein